MKKIVRGISRLFSFRSERLIRRYQVAFEGLLSSVPVEGEEYPLEFFSRMRSFFIAETAYVERGFRALDPRTYLERGALPEVCEIGVKRRKGEMPVRYATLILDEILPRRKKDREISLSA